MKALAPGKNSASKPSTSGTNAPTSAASRAAGTKAPTSAALKAAGTKAPTSAALKAAGTKAATSADDPGPSTSGNQHALAHRRPQAFAMGHPRSATKASPAATTSAVDDPRAARKVRFGFFPLLFSSQI